MTTGPGRALMISPRTPKSPSTPSSAAAFSCSISLLTVERAGLARLRQEFERGQRVAAAGAARFWRGAARLARRARRRCASSSSSALLRLDVGSGRPSKRGSMRRCERPRCARGAHRARRAARGTGARGGRGSSQTRARSGRAKSRRFPLVLGFRLSSSSSSSSSASASASPRQMKPAAPANVNERGHAEHDGEHDTGNCLAAARRATWPAPAAWRRRPRRRARMAAANARRAAGTTAKAAASKAPKIHKHHAQPFAAERAMAEQAIAPDARPAGAAPASRGPAICIIRSAAIAPGRPSRLCTGASVAWLSDGSCTDQVASAKAAIMARLNQRDAAELAQAPAQHGAEMAGKEGHAIEAAVDHRHDVALDAFSPQPSTATRRCNASAVISLFCTMATRI